MLLPDTARNRGRKNVATTAKVNTTVTATTAKVTGAKTIAATIKPGSFSIVNTPLKKDYDEVDCNYVDDTILTLVGILKIYLRIFTNHIFIGSRAMLFRSHASIF